VSLAAVGGSEQGGEAIITAIGDQTEVIITVTPGTPGVSQPAHIHDALAQGGEACVFPPKVKYPLTNVVDGKSTTLVNVSLATLQAQPFAVCVHKSVTEITIYTASGSIPLKVALAEIGGSGQSGEAVLTAIGPQTRVVINVTAGAAGVSQPAHIHDVLAQSGQNCVFPPTVKYPLTNVVNGRSITLVDASLATLLAQPFAVCVHKSVTEIAIYTAEGAIPTIAPVPTATATAVSLAYPKFTSNALEVSAGSTARFTLSSDQYDHTFTILALGVDVSVPANSAKKAAEFAVPTGASGTYKLICRIHESNGMVGTVQIAATAKTTPQVGTAPASGSSGGGGTPPADPYGY
jgi:plastocyanin